MEKEMLSSKAYLNQPHEKELLLEIEDFINKTNLTLEEIILKQIYPKYFYENIKNKYMSEIQLKKEKEDEENDEVDKFDP